ncbi:MAG: hypothetical protein WD928_03110 [Gammaproteobacteria bacterium]
MTVAYMETIRARYERLGYAPYRWFRADTAPPWAALKKPLDRARLGLISTAGVYALGQCAYHYKDDASIRAIPAATPREALRFSHITENYLVDAKHDPDCIFPLGTLRRLAANNVIGGLAERVFSCMGGIYSQRRVREEVAPALREACARDPVDAVLLVAM